MIGDYLSTYEKPLRSPRQSNCLPPRRYSSRLFVGLVNGVIFIRPLSYLLQSLLQYLRSDDNFVQTIRHTKIYRYW